MSTDHDVGHERVHSDPRLAHLGGEVLPKGEAQGGHQSVADNGEVLLSDLARDTASEKTKGPKSEGSKKSGEKAKSRFKRKATDKMNKKRSAKCKPVPGGAGILDYLHKNIHSEHIRSAHGVDTHGCRFRCPAPWTKN